VNHMSTDSGLPPGCRVAVRCSPKMVPGDMKVSTGLLKAKETFDEGQKAYAGTDHRQAA
jgi:hypothetical protein